MNKHSDPDQTPAGGTGDGGTPVGIPGDGGAAAGGKAARDGGQGEASGADLRAKLLGLGESSLRKSYYRELKHRLDEIEESERRYRTIFNATRDAILILDPETGLPLDCNQQAEVLYGRPAAELRSRTAAEVSSGVPPYDEEGARGWIELALAGEKPTFEWRALHASGRVFWVEVTLHRIELDGADCLLCVVRDIDERKRLEEQLRQSQKMEAIGRLAGGVAHDFNNMLGGILGATDLLRLRLKGRAKEEEYLNIITEAAESAADLTRKLLAFSRKGAMLRRPMDLHEALRTAVHLLERSLDRSIRLRLSLEAPDALILGDHAQLENVLLNLGLNARDAMPDGGLIEIATRVVDLDAIFCEASAFDLVPGPYVEWSVRDGGVGMSAEVMAKAFEPFFTTKGVGEGTGLGLAAVYGAIKDHQGAVHLYSEIDRGTIFRIYLPLIGDGAASPPVAASQPIRGEGTVLVVDDEPVMRTIAQGLLQDLGYTVLLAENGVEGVRRYEDHPGMIDLVLLDVVMPEMNGRDCFKAIRRLDPEARVVMSSGFARDAGVEELRAQGLRGFIKKPYRITELAQTIAEVLAID